jgi:hypothetical protein
MAIWNVERPDVVPVREAVSMATSLRIGATAGPQRVDARPLLVRGRLSE